MILINNNISCDIRRTLVDPNGNFIIMELKMSDKTLTLASIYGTNDDMPQFYKTIRKNINDFSNDNIVICGDWNLVLDPDMDNEIYRHINNPNARREVLKFIDEDQFIDIFRFINDDKGFTWRRLNPEKSKARLDYLSLVMRKPAFCICENKDAEQLRSNCTADQRHCFRYIDTTIPLLSKSEISSLQQPSVAVQLGLCRNRLSHNEAHFWSVK